ncbi:MAG: hypothetical protein KGZ68_00045 [Dechloromonas sp.]|jgi:hypothetical protein|nr:hypothetical protein [Dechloromonas sp.]
MQPSSIQYQHFWIELVLGITMIIVLAINPLEKALIATVVLGAGILASRTIHKGRLAAAKLAERRRTQKEAYERAEEARRQKQEALLRAQREAAEKYLT